MWPIVYTIVAMSRKYCCLIIISSLLLYNRFLTSFLCVSIPLYLQLPVWVQQSHHHFAKSCSIWILLPVVSLPFILPSIISRKSPSSQNIDNPSMFPLPNRVQYLAVFVYYPENFLISNFIKPADLFHSSPYPHFKGFWSSSVCLRQCPRLCCIQCYTPDQAFHYSLL